MVHRKDSLRAPLGSTALVLQKLPTLLQSGVRVTVNSDDPPYFGGWVTENLVACHREMRMSAEDILVLVRNGFVAAFVSEERRAAMLGRFEEYVALNGLGKPASASR